MLKFVKPRLLSQALGVTLIQIHFHVSGSELHHHSQFQLDRLHSASVKAGGRKLANREVPG